MVSADFLNLRSWLTVRSAWKHGERQRKIDALPPAYSASLSLFDKKILALPISQLVPNCKSGKIAPSEIMMAYGKMAVLAQKETNCLTEVMFEEALCTPSFANWGPGGDSDTVGSEGTCERLLMGVPISIKGAQHYSFDALLNLIHQ